MNESVKQETSKSLVFFVIFIPMQNNKDIPQADESFRNFIITNFSNAQ